MMISNKQHRLGRGGWSGTLMSTPNVFPSLRGDYLKGNMKRAVDNAGLPPFPRWLFDHYQIEKPQILTHGWHPTPIFSPRGAHGLGRFA